MMYGLIKASTARELTADSRKVNIKKKIEQRTYEGFTSAAVTYYLTKEEESELKALGYKLDHRSPYANAQIIRW